MKTSVKLVYLVLLLFVGVPVNNLRGVALVSRDVLYCTKSAQDYNNAFKILLDHC